MNNGEQLHFFIGRIACDRRLKPAHIALCLALTSVWITNQYGYTFFISRRSLMDKSRIRSYATYHKVIRDLQELGYLTYKPSYHPTKGSCVSLNVITQYELKTVV